MPLNVNLNASNLYATMFPFAQKMGRSLSQHQPFVVLAFFVALACIGPLSVNDFGIPYDEGTMDSLGHGAFSYVFENAPWPEDRSFRFHGPAIEFIIYTLQEVITDSDDYALMYRNVYLRHFISFLFYFLAVVVLYRLGRKMFKSGWWALLACAVFVLTPRFFAHAFYNSRDIPQLALFALSMLLLMRLIERQSPLTIVTHALVAAFALSVRITAILIPAFTFLLFAIEVLRSPRELRLQTVQWFASVFCIFFVIFLLSTIIFWPFLWEAPVRHFLEAYHFMSNLGGASDGNVEFLGKTYTGFPWNYIFVWIFVTVPIVYTIFFLTGIGFVLNNLARHISAWNNEHSFQLLLLLWFWIPILSIILSGAGIYTEWRHLYFIYPAFVLLSVMGFRTCIGVAEALSKKSRLVAQLALWLLLGSQMSSVLSWMINNHPYHYVYFSIPATIAEKNFPLDYWALSYKQITERLLEEGEEEDLIVYSDENIAFVTIYNLFPEGLRRVVRAEDIRDAQYVVTRDREVAGQLPMLHAAKVDGMIINALYKGPQYNTRESVGNQ